MKKAKSFLYLTQLNTRRIFRDFKYVLLIIALPMFFYVIYSEIFPQNAAVNGISWKEYSLISLICFGIMGNAINLLGTKVANEKNDNWYAYLKVSVINPNAYMMSYLFSYFLISFIFSVAMILLGYFYNDIHIAFYKLVEIVILLSVFSFAFLFLALIIGQLGSAAQPIGTIVYLLLSFLGGLWIPIDAMPKHMQAFAEILPSYRYGHIGWSILSEGRIHIEDVLYLIGYAILFFIIFLVLSKVNGKNK
ncbi:TPA: ABC transporter permease [Staphylococcus pseudintermedius]|nr:ABC transporter permease [Staphylococcus pseudintermedius]